MSPSCSIIFFNSLARSRYLSFFSHSFSFILWSAGTAKSTIFFIPWEFSTSALILWRCLWCNGYRRRKWIRQHEFKSWTRLIAFHVALISLGKVWIQLFSLQLWVNSRADWFFCLGEATSLGEGKLWIQTC